MAALAPMLALTAASTYTEAQAARQQARYQQRVADINAEMADSAAADALRRGDKEAAAYKGDVKRVAGAQRAAYAGQGVDVGSGAPVDVGSETQTMGALDALTIKNNAWREAFGYKTQAAQSRAEGKFARLAGRMKVRNTILTGGLQATSYGAQSYSGWKNHTSAWPSYSGSAAVRGSTGGASAGIA